MKIILAVIAAVFAALVLVGITGDVSAVDMLAAAVLAEAAALVVP